MQVNSASNPPTETQSVPLNAELLDKNGNSLGPIEASKQVQGGADSDTLKNMHAGPEMDNKMESTNSDNSEPKSKSGFFKKALIGIGLLIVGFLGFKFFFGKKK